MKLHQLLEDNTRIPNPLNNGTIPPEVYDVMDEFDDLENDFHTEYQNGNQEGTLQQRYTQSMQMLHKMGKVRELPIKDLITMEPSYDKAHADSISNGDPATVYKHKGKYYIVDGNHRVIADYNNNKPSTKAMVIDTNDVNREIERLMASRV